jgi:predicted ATPase/DNA-binding SARP family transcriptional activator
MRRAEYRLLGPLEVVKDGAPIALGRRQQRALLAILLLQPGSVVSTDRLVELLWPGTTPGRPKTAIQGYVSGLRKALGPEAILTRGGGYLLDAEWGQLDAARFEQLLTEAGAALARDEPETARGSLVQALALWRGSALSDFAYESWAQNEVGRLDELRLVAREHLIQARLALGEHAELVGELDAFVEEQPLRERARAQLMLALYRSGRQAEALETYHQARERLVEELGLEPSPELQELHRAILNQDPALAPPTPGPTAVDAPGHARLPAPPDAFIGRETELRDIIERLCRPDVRVVSLTGPGGSGKTRLALEAGHRLGSTFAGGVRWVPLVGVFDERVVGLALAQGVGARSLEAVPERIGDAPTLAIVDNAEHLSASVAATLGAVVDKCPALTVLVTTRERLQIAGEHVVTVMPLERGEAVALFVERARQVRSEFTAPPEDVERLCRRLDSLPLGIELAAGRVSTFTVLQILDRLDGREGFLKGGRNLDRRQETLEPTIAWSYDLLSDTEQQLLQRLSIFAGGFDLDAAEEVADAPVDVLQALVDKSLVQVGAVADHEHRFALLETIRAFAAALLADRTEERRRLDRVHAEYYLRRAEECDSVVRTPSQLPAIGWFYREWDNLRQAQAHFVERRDAAALARHAAATSFGGGAHIHEHAGWVDEALQLGVVDTDVRSRLRSIAAMRATMLGRLADADRLSRVAVEDAQTVGEPLALSVHWKSAATSSRARKVAT